MESVLSYHAGPGDQTQVARFGDRDFLPAEPSCNITFCSSQLAIKYSL